MKGKTIAAIAAKREDDALLKIRAEIERGMRIAWKITRKHFPVRGARVAFLNVARIVADKGE